MRSPVEDNPAADERWGRPLPGRGRAVGGGWGPGARGQESEAMNVQQFQATWRGSTLTERAASQSHFNDLCALFGEEADADEPLQRAPGLAGSPARGARPGGLGGVRVGGRGAGGDGGGRDVGAAAGVERGAGEGGERSPGTLEGPAFFPDHVG